MTSRCAWPRTGSPFSASPRRRRHAASIHSRARITLYRAAGCHLCERARDVLEASGERFEEVDISGDPTLEAEYREWLPVVEIDGERAFVYFVDPEAFRRKIETSSTGG